MVQSSRKVLRSGALAKATGLSPDTIRYYEKIGVLPRALRTDSEYRVYPAVAIERVLVVQRALRIGFTLAELAEVLKTGDSGGAPCKRVYALALEKVDGIAADIQALKTMHRYLKKVLADWKHRIENAGPGQKSHLLYSLTEAVNDVGDRMALILCYGMQAMAQDCPMHERHQTNDAHLDSDMKRQLLSDSEPRYLDV